MTEPSVSVNTIDQLQAATSALDNGDTDKWTAALQSFTTQCANRYMDARDHTDKISLNEKRALFAKLITLAQTDAWNEKLKYLAFAAIKIISRTRSGMEALYESKNILWLAGYVTANISEETKLEALRVMLNLVILNREVMGQFFNETKLHRGLLALLQSIPSAALRSIVLKLLFYAALDDTLAVDLIKNALAYQTLIKVFLDVTADLSFVSVKSDGANEQRRVVSQILKVLYSLVQDSSRPTIEKTLETSTEAKLFPEFGKRLCTILALGVTRADVEAVEKLAEEGKKERLELEKKRQAEEEAKRAREEEEKRKREAEAAAAAAAAAAAGTATPAAADGATNSTGDASSATATTAAGTSTSTASTAAPASASADADSDEDDPVDDADLEEFLVTGRAPPSLLKRREKRQQRAAKRAAQAPPAQQRARAEAAEDADKGDSKSENDATVQIIDDPEESDPSKCTLREIKTDVSNLCIGLHDYLADYLKNDLLAVHGLLVLTQTKFVVSPPKLIENNVNPLLVTLNGLVKASVEARTYAKKFVFTKWTDPVGSKKSSEEQMIPDGAVNERVYDANRNSLRNRLLRSITSMQWNLKQLASEFVWALCNEESTEYIRLAGFGNAVGLLAEKGLPGFGGLKQRAFNIDDLLRSGKKL